MSISDKSKPHIDRIKKKRKQQQFRGNAKRVKRFGDKVPDAKELEELREAETVFHSNLFKMEVEELLKEVKPQVPLEKLDTFLTQLESFLLNISESSTSSIDDFPIDVQVPIVKKIASDKGVFKFSPPTKFLKIGSFAFETVCSPKPIIDIAVEVPKGCWQNMDFLNERYHRKRALYLSYIAQALKEADFISGLKFTYHNCHLKPVLLIFPQEIDQLTVSLTAYPVQEAFKLTRYHPLKNNVRSSWMLKITENDLSIPTPYYNSTVLEDMLLPVHHSYLVDNITTQNIKDGIILVKIWCQQRGLMSGYGRLNGFIISMFIVYLIKQQKINLFMNSYQVFRCTLLALQHEKFEEAISSAGEAEGQPSLEDFKKIYDNIFIDSSGFLNIFYSVSKETIHRVKHEAKLGLQILDNEMPNCFNLLFMNKISAFEKFEYLILLKGPKKFRRYSKKLCKETEYLNLGENKVACVVPKICDILHKGLHKRLLLVDFTVSSVTPWSVDDHPPNPNCGLVSIGLLLNPEVPQENLEKGPLADDPQAKEFRNFWGDRSEIRRFRDGSIREAVYWPAKTIEEKRKSFSHMVHDMLQRHLGAEDKNVVVVGNDMDCILHIPKQILNSKTQDYGTGEEAHITVMQTFNALAKQLRSLEDLPLLISSIQGISPVFRFSEVFPPLPAFCMDKSLCFESDSKLKLKHNASKVPPFIPALEVVIGFEGSGKWPNDLEAIKRVKAAFFIKIAELVNTKYSLVAVPCLTHVDIIKDGFVFRLVLACHKELFLMKQHKLPNGVTKVRETDESQEFEVTTEILPKLNSMLHGLHQQHNTFGTACRFAKRWLSSHLKHSYIHDLTVELLVAYCYCHPEPYTCPSSPQTAFLRFLSLIVNHDWKTSPLVINLNNELQKNEIEEIHSTFTNQRSTFPAMVIATPFDKKGTLFTKKKPHPLILKRMAILARASLGTLEKNLYNIKEFDVKTICRPPLDSYDVLIYLKHTAVSTLSFSVDFNEGDLNNIGTLETYNEYVHKVYPVVEYDPALKYLEELRANFGEYAFFFHDIYGGDVIAVVWKKSAFTPREFKVSHVNCCVSKNGSIMGNVDCILEDFKLLGNGIVDYITQQKAL